MRKARRFISQEKQVFLVSFSLTFPIFPQISKNWLNTSLGQALCNPKKQKVHSPSGEFNWKENCFFRKSPVIFDDKHPDRNKESRIVRTISLHDNMLSKCRDRLNSWVKRVKGHLENCIDLVATEAVYHKFCHARFRSSKDLTSPN